MADEILDLDKDHFGMMIEAALVGIYIIQGNHFSYVNPALAHMFGYQPEELIDRIRVLDLIHPEDRDGIAKRIHQRFAGQLAAAPHTARGISRDGKIIHFESLSRFVIYQGEPAIMGTLINVTTCVQVQEKLKKQRRQLKRLSAQLIATREAESKRISQELHDVIGQALTAVSINLAHIEQALPQDTPEAIWERLAESEAIISQTLTQTRKLSLELRPTMLDDLGLLPTLRWYIRQFGNRLNIPASFTTAGIYQPFSSELETVIYRVVQEGLTNVARHAKANKVTVALAYEAEQLFLTVADDGVGFDKQQLFQPKDNDTCLGLLGIGERISIYGGTLDIDSSPGKGTTLNISFPHVKPLENKR